MAWEQGQFENLDVTEQLHIQGVVSGRTHVRDGSILMLQGVIQGDLTVDAEGGAQVQGTFPCENVENAGVLMVSGGITSNLPSCGVILVQPGTVLTSGDGPKRLLDGGRIESLRETDIDVSIDNRSGWVRLLPDGSFEPESDAS